jgi:polyisoprenoid-binding protein YceI
LSNKKEFQQTTSRLHDKQQQENGMKVIRTLLAVLTVSIFAACSGGDAPEGPPVSEGGLGIPAGTYAVDKSHTYVTFSYLHQGLSFPLLRIGGIDGELQLDPGALEKTRVSIVAAAASISTNTPFFDQELASPKFFNAAKYPHIAFAADSYEAINDSEGALSGQITIRGITQPIILTVKINGAMVNPITSKPAIGLSASGHVQRSDFGLDRFIPAVADRVDLKIEVEFQQGSSDESMAAANLARAITAGIE